MAAKTNAAVAYGEVVRAWHPVAGVVSVVTNKAGHQGDRV